MSALGISSQLPPISQALEPESVRQGSSAVKSAYQQGLVFEEMLTEELTKSLTEMGGLGEEGEEASGEGGMLGAGGSSIVSSLLPQALAQGVVAGGGLGLAAQLANEVAANEGSVAPAPVAAPSTTAGDVTA